MGREPLIANVAESPMSYEFHLANPRHSSAAGESGNVQPDSGAIDAVAETRKRRVKDALTNMNPHLEEFVFNYEVMANSLGITPTEARQRYRHIELNGPDDGNGIQIILWDNHATISVPFWHAGKDGESVMREMWGYMRLLNAVEGMTAFDAQLGRMLDLDRDFDAVLQQYAHGVSALELTDD